MKQPPAFQFYASDYLSSSKVQRMTLEAEGAYIRLLAYSWQDGWIPADVSQLARMCKCNPRKMAVLWDSYLRDCFVPTESEPDKLVNPRLEEIRGGLVGFINDRSRAGSIGGKRSGEIRRIKAEAKRSTASIVLEANAKQNEPLQSSVSSLQIPPIVPQNGNGSKPETGYSAEFEEFWKLYPKRVGKGDAFRAWKKLKPSQTLQGIICQAVIAQVRSPQWTRDSGQYIPNPSTWLNQSRWDDELPPTHQGDIHV